MRDSNDDRRVKMLRIVDKLKSQEPENRYNNILEAIKDIEELTIKGIKF